MIEPEQKPSDAWGRISKALSRSWEQARARWAQIPSSIRPFVLASLGVGVVGLSMFFVGLLLLLRAARPAGPAPLTGAPAAPGGSIPIRLRVKAVTLDVVPLAVREGNWPVPRGRGDLAYWMEGTFVNLVLGLPDRPETRRLVEGLQEGDVLEVEMSAGPVLRFQVSGKQQVRPEDTTLLSQRRPGLTLLLVGGEPRWAVTASPLLEPSVSLLAMGRVPLGLSVQVGPIRLTARNVELRWSGPGIPGDFVGVVIRFELIHTGNEPLAMESFEMSLADAAGRRYQPTSLEGVPIPSGRIAPGGTVEGQVAFLIPRNSVEGVLIWRFNPLPGRGAPAEIELELPRPTPTPAPETRLQIQVQSARWLPEERVLIVQGGIGNSGEQPVALEATEVELIGPGGQPAPLIEASPALPWMIPAGRNLGFELRFTLPAPGPATLRIGQARFQIR
ncbi:hypothetical protein [Thermoflexus sp.]|uniref:hypothetical protein n=1 Tax=Thermoflexus sp. TaxID=1969742 RepID=UPI0035E41481